MNNLEKWFWSLLSTKGSEFSSLAVKKPGPVSVQAAEDADTEEVLSVRENGSNAGKYVAEYLKAVGLGVGNPWCMAFVVFRVIKAAHKLIVNIPAHMPRTGSVAVYGNWAQSQGHFIRRADWVHVVYYIRSCDSFRHFRDDIYLCTRKLFWLIDRLKEIDPENWKNVKPGTLTMHITSLHAWASEKPILLKKK